MSPLDYELALMCADDGNRPDGTDWLDRITGGDWTADLSTAPTWRWLLVGAAKCVGAWLLLCAVFAVIALVAGA